MKSVKSLIAFGLISTLWVSCNTEEDKNNNSGEAPGNEEPIVSLISFANHSLTPAFVYAMPGFEKLEINTLISSEDQLKESPEFVFGGQPDGAGFMKDPSGKGYIMITNHEISIKSVFR